MIRPKATLVDKYRFLPKMVTQHNLGSIFPFNGSLSQRTRARTSRPQSGITLKLFALGSGCSGNSFSISKDKATRRMEMLYRECSLILGCTNRSQVPRRHNEPDLRKLGLRRPNLAPRYRNKHDGALPLTQSICTCDVFRFGFIEYFGHRTGSNKRRTSRRSQFSVALALSLAR